MSALSRIRPIYVIAATLLCLGLIAPMQANSAQAATRPGVATNLRAVPSSSSVVLSWTAPSNAKTYGVCLYTSATAKSCFKWYGGRKSTSLTIKNLKPTGGRDYFFTVLSYNGSAFSRTGKLGFDLGGPVVSNGTKPATPSGLKATTAKSTATLSWKAATGANYYGVCLYTSASTTACHTWHGNIRGTSLKLNGLSSRAGMGYGFTVLAYNSQGLSRSTKVGFSLPTTTIPATPTGLKATTAKSSATLSWSATPGANYYGVCLYTSAAATKCHTWYGNIRSTTLKLNGLDSTGRTQYFFTVLAYNPQGLSRSAKVAINPGAVKPAVVTGMQHTIGTNDVTITWPAAANAETYSVCLLTNPKTTQCTLTSVTSNTTSATFSGLSTTPDTDWYYIVRAYGGGQSSSSARIGFDLPVTDVAGFTTNGSTTNSITFGWDAVTNAERYQLQIATDSAMSKGLITRYPTATPYTEISLTPGTTYYFQIRAENGVVKSGYTAISMVRLPTAPTSIDVLTFNLCGQDHCRNGETAAFKKLVPVWKTRKPLAGALVRTTASDIIATQESGDKDTNFITELPGFARAEYLSGKSLFYKTARYDLVRSGKITLSSILKRYAVWAEFRDKATRTRFIVIDAHLQPYKGQANDDERAAETQILIDSANMINPESLPTVYAGDYNSNKSNAQSKYPGGYDAPFEVMAAAGIPDARNTAVWAWHVDYNSANQAKNPPYRYGDHVDHIFVSPDIQVAQWGIVTRLTPDGQNYLTPFATDHNPLRSIMTIPGQD